ncbi:methionyl-tRNA formyltransferase [Leptospira inadai serovar Lyme str. 10]|uniref:Methionyl-tRNA formyltransferase n=2 Tax=Leptospira inadai serovar Lyme TaxID=293084 RepID=V6HC97_9LEPT|nr:methionyl-tRNA formyltransferase [Leptospira inadai]EQA37446.1 methionyl-tRNA formyltransferase [Leptospira inadai serovar Lyme str. 10]PNV76294.1 methionyl-tRNA formyltransferase [Leptospira inadai serovar Lyme]
MKIAFFGTPEHSAKLLSSLLEEQDIEILFVVTNPDRPKGRSKTPSPSPVKEVAQRAGLPVFQFESIKKEKEKAVREFSRFPVELYLVFAYGSILPKEVFQFPKFGSINLHGSLLPELRGASPVQTALWKGYSKTGISIQYIGEGMDEGDIIQAKEITISMEDDTGTLMDRITQAGTECIKPLIQGNRSERFPAIAQDHSQATYCTKLKSEDRILEFTLPAIDVHNRIRALAPDPGAVCNFRDKRLVLRKTVWTDIVESPIIPGRLKRMDRKGLLFQCGDGRFLEIISLQPENKNRMSAADFLNGFRITEEDRFQ